MRTFILLLIAFILPIPTFAGISESGKARVILNVPEGFSGYQMLLDADANTYNTVNRFIPVFVLSYRHFEYKLPANADGNPATANKITNGSQGVDIPAGSYDYFIVQPTTVLYRIECEAGYTQMRGHNFVFEAGKAYRFTVFNFLGSSINDATWDVRPLDAPVEPSGLTLSSNSSGVTKCTLQWKNPDRSIQGASLSALASVTILRDNRIVEYIANPAPGAVFSWTDTNPLSGSHTYSIYASNSAGDGFSVSGTIVLTDIVQPETARKDAAVTAFLSPVSGANLSNAETVRITVKNTGTQTISSVPLRFDINGLPAGSGTYSGNIAANGEITHEFAQKADLSVPRTSYALKAYTALEGDENPDNNALVAPIDNFGDCRYSTPYFCGFEDNMDFNCWNIYGNSDANYQWTRINNTTDAPQFIRTGQSGMRHPWQGGKDWLVSPAIRIPDNGAIRLSFWSQYISGEYGKNSVWITESSDPDPSHSTAYTQIWSLPAITVEQEWIETQIDLSNYKGKEIHIAFCYEGISGQYSQLWALDDVSIIRLPDKDAGVTGMLSPRSGARLTGEETVKITVHNFGSQTLTNIPVHYQINDQAVVSGTITSLGAQKDTVYTFTTKADLSAEGNYTIRAYTALAGDENTANDEKTLPVSNYGECKITDFPYIYGFENRDSLNCWTVVYPGPVNIPDIEGKDISAPYEGDHFWRFTSFYGNGTDNKAYEQYLITPELAVGKPKTLEFYYRPSDISALRYTGFRVGYSTTDTQNFTWISDNETVQMAWMKYTNIIPADAKYIAILSYTRQSFLYIDRITIDLLPESKDVSVEQILSPFHGNAEPVPVKAIIKNLGGVPVTDLTISYQVMDNTPVNETYRGTIDPAASIAFEFSQKADLSEYRDDYRLKVYTSLEGDLNRGNDIATVRFIYRPNIQLYGYRISDYMERYGADARSPVVFSSDNPSQLSEINLFRDGDNIITACEYVNDTLYCYSNSTVSGLGDRAFILLTGDWSSVLSRQVTPTYALDMAYDYTTRTMYAVVGSQLRKVDLQTGTMTAIAGTRLFWTLACDLKGQLYGIDENGWFCKIDKKYGTATSVKRLDVMPGRSHQSMAFDHHTERLFWAMSGSGFSEDGRPIDLGRLYEINPETGDAVCLGSINGGGESEIVGLHTHYKHNDTGIRLPKTGNASIFVYPNPSGGEIHLYPLPENAVIRILDMSGRSLETYTGLSGNVDLNLNLSKGIYFIQIEGNHERTVQKLIIK